MEEQRVGVKIKKSEFLGVGAIVQLIGLLFFFWLPLGPIITIIFLVWGSRMSFFYICGTCGNKLSGKFVSMCPACKTTFPLT